MKRILIILFLLLPLILNGQQIYIINFAYKDLSFKEFVNKAEESLPVKFFYRDDWTDGLILGDYSGAKDLKTILTGLFTGKPLYLYIDKWGNVIITKDYAIKASVEEASESKFLLPGNTVTVAEEEGDEIENTYVELGNPAERYRTGNVLITGYVTNSETGEPLAGVSVFIQKLGIGTFTNNYGFYSLSAPRGQHLLQFSYVGMKEHRINLKLNGQGDLNIEMKSVLIPIKGVVVSAERNMLLKRFEVGLEKLNIVTFRLMPTTMGETDVLKSILLIPGVKSVGEGSSGFNVRGGAADQNLILINGAPVHNPSHFFGFFSAINPDIIKDVTLYKGGIPGRYGGRLSSVLDIEMRDGSRTDFSGRAGISPVTTSLMVEGPAIKDTLTYLIAARTTYSDWLFDVFKAPQLKNSSASFSDINVRLTWHISKTNKVDFSTYLSNDAFSFKMGTKYSYLNSVTSVKWQHFFTTRFFSVISLNNSFYRYNITDMVVPEMANRLSHSLNSSELRAEINWFRGRHELNYGIDITNFYTNPGSVIPWGDASTAIPRNIERERGIEASAFIDERFNVTDILFLNAGVRLSSFFTFGPQTVYTYDSFTHKSKLSITDTLRFKPGQAVSQYFGPELRLSANIKPDEYSSVKINYNRTRQNIILLSNTTAISPTDTWKLSDYHLKPQTADQVAAGYYRMLFDNRFEFSAEVYYKKMKNLSDFKPGSYLVMNENIEQSLVNAEGKAYGAEFSFKKTEGKVRYTIGYTYSRSFLRSSGKFPEEIVNKGKWYPSYYDMPNDLVVTFNYLFSRRLSFSANYTYTDGRPVTIPVSTFHVGDVIMVHYSDRNSYRIPDYARLDLSLRLSGNLKSKKIANPNWTFSIYNVLSKDNIYSVYFQKEGINIKGYAISVFDRAIPSITFNFDF